MELRTIDKVAYRALHRKVSWACMLIFALLGVGCATLMRHWFGNPEGQNTWVNLAGVLVGLVISGGIFAIFRNHPLLDELIYVWRLKRETLRIQNKIHKWKALLAEGNQTAATVLEFHYSGVLLVQYLENNEFGESETRKQLEAHREECAALGLQSENSFYESSMLALVK